MKTESFLPGYIGSSDEAMIENMHSWNLGQVTVAIKVFLNFVTSNPWFWPQGYILNQVGIGSVGIQHTKRSRNIKCSIQSLELVDKKLTLVQRLGKVHAGIVDGHVLSTELRFFV